jgi:prefoldin subunit 5
MAQSIQDLSAEVNAVRQDIGVLADQIDSLRSVVTKQDSVVRTLANLAGVSFPR